MIVPATCIYSLWRFAQNSWDMGPWNKHHYFRFYKLGVGKVIRDGPLEITGGGETVPPQKIPARETCLKKILQALIPHNNKLYALEKDYCRQAGFFKKILHQNFSFSWKSLKSRVLNLSKNRSRNNKENSVSDQSVYPISRTIRVFFHGVIKDVSAV